jgi:thermitase
MRAHFAAAVLVAAATSATIEQVARPSPERPTFRGLNAKVAASRTEAVQDINETAKDAATAMGSTWSVRDVDTGRGAFRLSAPPTESNEQTTPAEAWQMAHALRADKRFSFEYVEPAFAVNGAPGETTELEDCQTAAAPFESGGDTTPIEGATKDSEWSLDRDHGANVLEAWKRFPAGVAPGMGVWIGHPDTGYRNHPEIFGMANSPIHPDLGWDFVDNDRDPTDAFVEGTLRWPGHGTRTSSVIVSPRGRQLPGGATRGISGVAPGARLIPLRVANGVVLFDQANLASAIRAAAGSDRNLVKQQVDVISISLGGPPSRPLEDAVKLAEDNGVLVIAAAGNNVKKVVWPARYPHVIAMAASNFDSKVWSGSSGGSMVAIGAPGESVWIANPKMDGGSALDCLSMSSGTSYATATTAGIAAMWVSLHKDTDQFKALKKGGQVTTAFRKILQSTKRPGKNWDTGKYGPGIVDAKAVLEAKLPPPQESAPASESPCDRNFAALESLFETSRDPRQRIAQLFDRKQPTDACAVATVADEVAFHYATDANVSTAIDAVSGRPTPSRAALSAARTALRAVGSDELKKVLPEK